jgi:hypothetical protein
MGVAVDQARDYCVAGALDDAVGSQLLACLCAGQEVADSTVVNGDAMLLKDLAMRFDGYHPLGMNQAINVD